LRKREKLVLNPKKALWLRHEQGRGEWEKKETSILHEAPEIREEHNHSSLLKRGREKRGEKKKKKRGTISGR